MVLFIVLLLLWFNHTFLVSSWLCTDWMLVPYLPLGTRDRAGEAVALWCVFFVMLLVRERRLGALPITPSSSSAVTTGQSPCWSASMLSRSCWSWRLVSIPSNYVGIPVKLLFSGWFFILKVAMEVKRIIYPHLSFLKVAFQEFLVWN
jgi:hypothetical protein